MPTNPETNLSAGTNPSSGSNSFVPNDEGGNKIVFPPELDDDNPDAEDTSHNFVTFRTTELLGQKLDGQLDIHLQIPEDGVEDQVGQEWEFGENSSKQILTSIQSIRDQSKEDVSSKLAQSGLDVGNTIAQFVQGDEELVKLASAQTRKTISPGILAIFKRNKQRAFSFTWKLYPRSKAEAKTIQDIADIFKASSMGQQNKHRKADPTTFADQAALILYPPTWEIKFKHDAGLFPIKSCIIEDVQAKYGSGGYSEFTDHNPTVYILTVSFKELSIQTSDSLYADRLNRFLPPDKQFK